MLMADLNLGFELLRQEISDFITQYYSGELDSEVSLSRLCEYLLDRPFRIYAAEFERILIDTGHDVIDGILRCPLKFDVVRVRLVALRSRWENISSILFSLLVAVSKLARTFWKKYEICLFFFNHRGPTNKDANTVMYERINSLFPDKCFLDV